jgi:hypothetical protein
VKELCDGALGLALPSYHPYFAPMSTAAQIEALAQRAKSLPEDRQQAVVDAMRELLDEPYQLSDVELAILTPALADAEAGRNLMSLGDVDQRTRKLIATWPK